MKRLILALLALLTTQCHASSATPESFWSWFKDHDNAYFSLAPDDVVRREPLFDELSTELGKVNPDLTFEFGPLIDGKRDFVISAGGIKDAFPAVRELVAHAPALAHWRVIAFRPRRSPVSTIEFQDVKLKPEQVRVRLAADGAKIGLTLLMPGYTEARGAEFGQAAYLLLDEALGEYDVETKVGFIGFEALPLTTPADTVPLSELSTSFDRMYGSTSGKNSSE
jgi:hypothetical protein